MKYIYKAKYTGSRLAKILRLILFRALKLNFKINIIHFTHKFIDVNKSHDSYIQEIDKNFAKLEKNVDNLKKEKFTRTSTEKRLPSICTPKDPISPMSNSKFY